MTACVLLLLMGTYAYRLAASDLRGIIRRSLFMPSYSIPGRPFRICCFARVPRAELPSSQTSWTRRLPASPASYCQPLEILSVVQALWKQHQAQDPGLWRRWIDPRVLSCLSRWGPHRKDWINSLSRKDKEAPGDLFACGECSFI